VTVAWDGLALGALYALVASSYNLILAASGVLNFAQGAIVMLGTFMGYVGIETWHLSPVVVVIFGAAGGCVAGLVSEVVCVRPLMRREFGRARSQGELITTVGIATVFAGTAGLIWGYNPLAVDFPGTTTPLTILGGKIYPLQLFVISFAILVAVSLHLWARQTRLGLASLAVSEDREAAIARGVNASRISLGSFGLAGSLGGIAGVLVAPTTFAYPDLGNILALSGFVAVAIGGAGAQIAGMIAGLLIGVVGNEAARFFGADYSNLSIFAVLVVTLMIRPRGLGGKGAMRSV
jgi:branched-chain amino acid transport system permease protein